ncbi:MAG: AsmA family protein [Bacteroidales bacterium]|nr:AsmA family protein [Bacteroidales bacterium]
MKKLVRIFLITGLVLLTAVIVLPLAFKGRITQLTKEEINKNLNATVGFGDIGLSLFRSFPHLSLSIADLSVVNKIPFEGDTLFAADKLRVTLDIMSVFRGAPYEIRKISIHKPNINLRVLEDGTSNWDIALATEAEPEDSTVVSDEDGFLVSIQKLQISDGRLSYHDRSIPFFMSLEGVNHTLSGDLSASTTRLETSTTADKLVMTYDGITYLNGVKAAIVSGFDADLDNFIFHFREGEVLINDLKILASGMFGMPEEGYDMDLSFKAPGSAFAEVLSLVPAIYAKDFSSIKTTGTFSLEGQVKGRYSDTKMPSFALGMIVKDGYFKYPDLPSAVENIALQLNIGNPDGIPDHTVIDLSRLHLDMAGAPLDASLLLRNPVTDPAIRASLKTRLDLTAVQTFYPLEGTELKGKIDGNIELDGRMSSIEEGKYEEFKASGSVSMQDIRYLSEGMPVVGIASGIFSFSPERLGLSGLRMQAGRSDLVAEGFLSNYLAWFLKDEMLLGKFNVVAGTLDLNEFMENEGSDTPASDPNADSSSMQAVSIPSNIDFTLNTSANKVVFGDLELEKVRGQVRVANSAISLDDVSMNTLEGSITANGSYRAPEGKDPYVSMDLALVGISIPAAYEKTGMMRKLAPVARHTKGKISTSMRFEGFLDQGLMPVYSSLNGGGSLATSPLIISGLPVLTKIGEALSLNELKESMLEPVQAAFEFREGRVHVKPFPIRTGNLRGNVSGSTGFDQTLDYSMDLDVPRALMGNAANNLITKWTQEAQAKGIDVKAGEMIKVAILIGGTVSDPTIRTGFAGMADNLKEEIKQIVEQKVEEVKQEIRQEASKQAEQLLKDAQQEADKLMAAARDQAAQVRSAAYQAATKVREEADRQANKVIAEGKARGPIAAAVAEKTAAGLRKEADQKARALEQEGDRKADGIVREAQTRTDQLLESARKKAGEI